MINDPTPNIYFEILISNLSKSEIWQKILKSNEFHNLFINTDMDTDFKENNRGKLLWRRLLFWKVTGQYHILSYQENMNFLIDITSLCFSSTLLFTLQDNEEGILLRIDHRSFIGKYKNIYYNSFFKRWRSLIQQFEIKK